MKYLPSNTLAYFNSAPHFHRHDMSDMPTSVFSASTKVYREDCGLAHPNHEAMDFYALNHCASIVRRSFTPNEPLPDWAQKVMGEYMAVITRQGKRMLHYVLSICVREMRHLHHGSMSSTYWATVENKYTPQFKAFIDVICGKNESAAVEYYMNHPPACQAGKFIAGLASIFDHGKWSPSFGGPKWGEVAHCCEKFMHGKISMEMMVDTGYTLAHNGGPIFNKGMMYQNYELTSFLMILDVQRSGQIPDLILDPTSYGPTKTPLATEMVKLVQQFKSEEFKGVVDWPQVQKLGAVGSYSHLVKKQVKPPAPPKPVFKTINGKKAKITGEFAVWPKQTVTTYERVSA